MDLAPLGAAMADPRLVKVLHGADYDVTTLKRDFGFSFASLFDTMLAARLLGKSELGLVAVARDELGVTLTKTNQKDDWSRRPLTPQQEAYALADVTPPGCSCASGSPSGSPRSRGSSGCARSATRSPRSSR